jgi:hypothetical protein
MKLDKSSHATAASAALRFGTDEFVSASCQKLAEMELVQLSAGW